MEASTRGTTSRWIGERRAPPASISSRNLAGAEVGQIRRAARLRRSQRRHDRAGCWMIASRTRRGERLRADLPGQRAELPARSSRRTDDTSAVGRMVTWR